MVFRKLLAAFACLTGSCMALAQTDASGYIVQTGAVVDNFESTGWTTRTGDVQYTTSRKLSGTQALRLAALPQAEAIARKAITLDLNYSTTIGFWVYVEVPAQYDVATDISLALSNDNYSSELYANVENLRQGWNKVVLSWADFSSRNGARWGRFTQAQLRLFDNGRQSTVYFDDLMVGQFTRPKVVISFDDAYDDHYTEAFQYLRSVGLPGTAYINSSFIGQPGRLTEAQCQEMYAAGWDMANHTDTHANLTLLSQAEQEAEIARCRNYLINKGWTRRNGHLHFAYPYGFYNSSAFSALENTNTLTARTTWEGRQANVLDERYLLYGQLPENIRSTPSDLISLLDHFVLAGGLFELSYHMIVTSEPTNPNQIRQSEFREVIDYIVYLKDQGVIDVVTKSEWYEGLSGPRLSGLSLAQTQIIGGQSTTGTVTLNQAAIQGGINVALASNSSAVTVPASKALAQGVSSGTFTVQTAAVGADTTATITASHGGYAFSATLLVRPVVTLTTFTSNLTTVQAGKTAVLTVGLNRAADANFTVALSSSSTWLSVPTSLVVPAGASTKTLSVVPSSSITSDTNITVTASANGVTKSVVLTVKRLPVISGLSFSDSSLYSGQTMTATVTLDINAPTGGTLVTIPARNLLTMPTSVTIPAGTKKATFTIKGGTVTTLTYISVATSFNGSTRTRTLSIRP